jgi:hypothetical protein
LFPFPRLACPGLWWRVTAIALILCGKSPQKLGAEMWKASPTIQALIKMVTSSKFRFPTADCNEIERDRMRAGENNVKEKVSFIKDIFYSIFGVFKLLTNPRFYHFIQRNMK